MGSKHRLARTGVRFHKWGVGKYRIRRPVSGTTRRDESENGDSSLSDHETSQSPPNDTRDIGTSRISRSDEITVQRLLSNIGASRIRTRTLSRPPSLSPTDFVPESGKSDSGVIDQDDDSSSYSALESNFSANTFASSVSSADGTVFAASDFLVDVFPVVILVIYILVLYRYLSFHSN